MQRGRWKNWAEGGQVAFVTTTALDFAPVFGRPCLKELAAASLLADCQRYRAPLHAFVVMSNHLHLVVECPPEKSVSWLVQRSKSNLAKAERAALSQQAGLNRCSLWRAGFRSFVVEDRAVFDQKVRYVHENLVRAGLCAREEEHRWSSARLCHVEGIAREDGLDLGLALGLFSVAEQVLEVEDSLGTGRAEA